ncbi:hypothetical protein EJ08DRAFT_675472 [Tothia fuscella]|uniref:Uncharacterized protein n=1 Tax=Tothia fuscella TaxID=1048955 RepID=A0A9P4P0I3_9PEZI|nr:hypothetical protein EJ08DRAFT_675472 [Tothia fuscella]
MFARALADQENAVHAHQTAAAAKPLNAGVKGLNAKTPGNRAPKTPFKIPLNDENALGGPAGKSILKTNGKGGGGDKVFGTVKKGGMGGDKNNVFVTPAGPRNRAPLGAKTTNARALQTPGLGGAEVSPEKSGGLKTVSPRLRRAKVKVHQAEVVAVTGEVEEREREIEYMPPRAKPLPDYPSDDEFGPDKTFPQFNPENFTRGWASVYTTDDNGVSFAAKRDAEFEAKTNAYTDDLLKKSMDDSLGHLDRSVMDDLQILPSPTKSAVSTDSPPKKFQPAMKKPSMKLSAPPTLTAKSAATALGRTPKAAGIPSYAASTGTTKPKIPSSTTGILGRKIRPTVTRAPPSGARQAAAVAASHSTLGYAKGRAASQGLKKPLSSIFKDETTVVPATAAAAPKKDAVRELEDIVHAREEAANANAGDDDDDFFGGGGGVSLTAGEEDEEEFQLSVPSL